MTDNGQAVPLPDGAVNAAVAAHAEFYEEPADDSVRALASKMLAAAADDLSEQGAQEAVRRHVAEQHAVHADLAQLLRILGLGDHARPQSPHEVMLDAINEVGKLRQSVDDLREQGAAAERERLEHRVNALLARHDHLPAWLRREIADLLEGHADG